jgi:hypothetical protein
MDPDNIEEAQLKRPGIERVPTPVYLRGGYRFGNVRDAYAAARRGGPR